MTGATEVPVATITASEIVAIRIAWDELCSYIETVGAEGSLDDEEMPTLKLPWAERKLRALLTNVGELK